MRGSTVRERYQSTRAEPTMRIKTLASDAAPSFATAEDVKPERTMREDMLDVACRFDVRDFQTQPFLHATP